MIMDSCDSWILGLWLCHESIPHDVRKSPHFALSKRGAICRCENKSVLESSEVQKICRSSGRTATYRPPRHIRGLLTTSSVSTVEAQLLQFTVVCIVCLFVCKRLGTRSCKLGEVFVVSLCAPSNTSFLDVSCIHTTYNFNLCKRETHIGLSCVSPRNIQKPS